MFGKGAIRGSTKPKDPEKKLRDFHDPKSTQLKKFKSLVGYCESATSTDEVKALFEKEAYNIWSCFLDTFQFFEQKSTTQTKEIKDIEKLLLILKRILVYLPQKIKEKWQIRSISNILEKILYKENRLEIRLQGMELLLLFLEDIETPEASQQNLFASAINLEVFDSRYTSKKIILPKKALSAPDASQVLIPSLTPPRVEDATALIEVILEFMVSHSNSFELFWSMFRTHYLTVFYPDVCKEVGILDRFSDVGYPGFCPPEIQATIVTHLNAMMNVDGITQKLWTNAENTAIMLEICRQSCLLPMEHMDTIKKSVTFFKKLFLGTKQDPIPKILRDQPEKLKSFQRFYVEQLPNLFKTETRTIGTEQQVTIYLEIFELFKQTFEMLDTLSIDIRDVILFTLLEITTTVLKPDNPNQELAKSLAAVMVDTLLFTWISAKTSNVKMWARLQEALQSVFHRIEPVMQVKLKLLQLSLIVNDFMYPNLAQKKSFKRENVNSEKANKVADASIPERRRDIPVSRDPSLANLPWDYESAFFTWNSLLRVFNSMNKIKDPSIHSEAVGCISDVIDIFLYAESKAPQAQLIAPTVPNISLLQMFGQSLFEACTLHDKYYEGKIKAIGALCRIIVRHYEYFPGKYPDSLLPNFYTTIHSSLVNPPAINSHLLPWHVLENSFNIFNLALKGSSVLIPYYLIEVKKMLRQNCSVELRKIGITILGSLVSYSSHFGDTNLPMQFYGHLQKTTAKELGDNDKMTYLDMRDRIVEILMAELSGTKDMEITCMCLCNLGLVLAEVFASNPGHKSAMDLVKLMLGYTNVNDWNVSIIALDALALLVPLYHEKNAEDKKASHALLKFIIENLCTNLQTMVTDNAFAKEKNELREKIIIQYYFSLAEWILGLPSMLEPSNNLLDKVFYTIRAAFHALSVDMPSNTKEETKMSTLRKLKKKVEPQALPEVSSDDLAKKSPPTIQDAADYLLQTLLEYHRNYPSQHGVEFMGSHVTENDDGGMDESSVTHYVYNNEMLISFVEITREDSNRKNNKYSRVFLRTSTSKNAWDFSMIPPPTDDLGVKALPTLPPSSSGVGATKDRDSQKAPSNRNKGTLPLYSESEEDSDVDKIAELLQYVTETQGAPEGRNNWNQPSMLSKQFLGDLMQVQKNFTSQASEDKKSITDSYSSTSRSLAISPPEEPIPQHNFHNCRILLNQLGFLEPIRVEDLKLIDNSKSFQLKLKNLDKSTVREMVKVGLVYVKDGQDEQAQILKNDTGSTMYTEFVNGLGWTAYTGSHKGYLGGLDPVGTNGKEYPYWASGTIEVAYHEIVRMPTNYDDPQQLLKKRHVGNDSVHVIFSEHGRDYSPKTITSQFNDAHIIVYPLPNGLFRIQIAKKPKVPFFGPLIHGMTVTKRMLPLLVRQTAINAYRYIRYTSEGYEKPFFNRSHLFQEIVVKHGLNPDYLEVLKGPMVDQENKSLLQTLTSPASPPLSPRDPPPSFAFSSSPPGASSPMAQAKKF